MANHIKTTPQLEPDTYYYEQCNECMHAHPWGCPKLWGEDACGACEAKVMYDVARRSLEWELILEDNENEQT
jgi:hypothetical protein